MFESPVLLFDSKLHLLFQFNARICYLNLETCLLYYLGTGRSHFIYQLGFQEKN